jgi:hypothetical protein
MAAPFPPIVLMYYTYPCSSEQLYQLRILFFWLEVRQTVGLSPKF